MIKFLYSTLLEYRLRIILFISFQIISGFIPIIIAWSIAELINTISITHTWIIEIFIFVAVIAILLSLQEIISLIHNFLSFSIERRVSQKINLAFMEKVALWPGNDIFEDPKLRSKLTLAKDGINRVNNIIWSVSSTLRGFFSLLPAIFASFIFTWWIPTVLLLTVIPMMYVMVKSQHKVWNVYSDHAELFKNLHIKEHCLTSDEFSKELRLYGMQARLLEQWKKDNEYITNKLGHLRKYALIKTLFWCLPCIIGLSVSLFYIVSGAIHGSFSLGNLSFLLSLIVQFISSSLHLLYGVIELLGIKLSILPLITLLKTKYEEIKKENKIPEHSDILLEFKNVSFSYGNGNVLHNLNFQLKTGQSLAIVGENGAGKSTLVKLISRFYKPSSGTIFWKGVDINTINRNEYYKQISAVFQDFAKFPLSIRENIDPGQLSTKDDNLRPILVMVDLSNIKDNLDLILSRQLKGGIELSGGQWQRLAIARTLLSYKHGVDLVIFDEPTSALDANIEYSIANHLTEVMKNTTSIIISHRLSLSKLADKIIVIENGKIIESGNHNDLIKSGGIYSSMFQKQADTYIRS
ncbi:ABC transporter ATP-binding/permease protein [Candidatus Cyrtobacter comes]|uniref:ABC transporter ATP-binding/permease protein n=1 Tax=Candidatus Cyrtobacter comes TaxID=675776 RepID=A0ABU5L842_9RICK|nr:ABC transporter ATP-binding protein [Candidatus Cyrtobacter comes]MDZ5762296.1 ABC transporter ATP-binding/permease protein [Candidatus Cyrtobacter comes]